MTLRRRFLCLNCLGGLIVAALIGLLVWVRMLYAQGTETVEAVRVFNVLSMSGVLALAGVAVQWGATRERMKDIHTLKRDFTDRLDRIERQIDSLYELVGAERRHLDRRRYGERADLEDDGA